jgi:outer membrane protein assembly factor BamB
MPAHRAPMARYAARMGRVLAAPAGEPAIIDLGYDRGPDIPEVPPRRTGPAWPGAVVLAVLVVLFPAGSAAPPPPILWQVLSVPTAPTDSFTVTAESMLLIHSPTEGELTAYDLRRGRLQWRVDAPGTYYRVRSVGGLVLLRSRESFSVPPQLLALSVANGEVRWRHAGGVVAVPGASTLLGVSEVPTRWGPARGVNDAVIGVDAATGARRWSVPVPSTAVVQPVAGEPPRVLLVHDNGEAEIRDPGTGQLVAVARLPGAAYTLTNPAVVGDAVLLSHTEGGRLRVSGYDARTLARRWSGSTDSSSDARPCGPLACFGGWAGVRAVDPATGTERWFRPGWRSIEQVGGLVVAYGSGSDADDLIGTVDPATGRLLVKLRRWRAATMAGEADHIVVTRTTADGGTAVAVAGPAGPHARVLGDLPAISGSCRAVAGRLVCRTTSGRLTAWAYRPG